MSLTDAVLSGLSAGDTGAELTIIQSINNEQILLPELGYVNALQAYLKLNGIPYRIDERINAEDMSPSGELPLILFGRTLVAGYDKIIEFLHTKGLARAESGDNEIAYADGLRKVLIPCELYYTWRDPDIYEQLTKPCYGYRKPWPLGPYLCWSKSRDVYSGLSDHQRQDEELELFLEELSSFLNTKPNLATEFLCLVYGHLVAIEHLDKFYHSLSAMVHKFPALTTFLATFAKRIPKH